MSIGIENVFQCFWYIFSLALYQRIAVKFLFSKICIFWKFGLNCYGIRFNKHIVNSLQFHCWFSFRFTFTSRSHSFQVHFKVARNLLFKYASNLRMMIRITDHGSLMKPTWRGEGGFKLRLQQSASTRRAQLSVAVLTVRLNGSFHLCQDLSQCWFEKIRKAFSSKKWPLLV